MYNTSIYSLRFVHRTTQMEFPLRFERFGPRYSTISDMFQGVEYFSISQARPGKRFIRPSWEVNDGLACEETSQKWSNQPKQSGVFYHIVESLYVSIASFQYRTGNMVGKSPKSASLRLNGSAQPLTTSSMTQAWKDDVCPQIIPQWPWFWWMAYEFNILHTLKYCSGFCSPS